MSKAMYCNIIEAISERPDGRVDPFMCDICEHYTACQGKAAVELTDDLCQKLGFKATP